MTEVLTTNTTSRSQVLAWAAALESQSTHPLATAITSATSHRLVATQVAEAAGQGMTGIVQGAHFSVGSPRWLRAGELADQVAVLEQQGITVIVIHRDDQVVGAIGVRDELRPETTTVMHELQNSDYGVTMLTGDNIRTAQALAAEAGIDAVQAELQPQDKATVVNELQARGPVAMVGDGINDAPALASATVGIAMGAKGSDVAVEAADVAIIGDDLQLIPRALHHARRGHHIITQNIILSLAIIIVLLPLAITGVLGLAAVVLVHELAEVIVIANGLRAGRTQATAKPNGTETLPAQSSAPTHRM